MFEKIGCILLQRLGHDYLKCVSRRAYLILRQIEETLVGFYSKIILTICINQVACLTICIPPFLRNSSFLSFIAIGGAAGGAMGIGGGGAGLGGSLTGPGGVGGGQGVGAGGALADALGLGTGGALGGNVGGGAGSLGGAGTGGAAAALAGGASGLAKIGGGTTGAGIVVFSSLMGVVDTYDMTTAFCLFRCCDDSMI